ncbi:MORN repeat-containing protein 3 isoform X3 [Hydra vulgaris]|uniref:MORN repeat-containing protein 3 n=1 Tax=Hydra vulgaris TaxID=6087 RepID=A0ABM4CQL8_HYDVU
MPIKKDSNSENQQWKKWDLMAQKTGLHHTVYLANGDKYTGEWKNNLRHGKGTQYWQKTGAFYDGDWENDMRHGHGTFSLPFQNNKLQKVYEGGWSIDKKHGYGTYFYGPESYYEGEWYKGLRSGWGRMYYPDKTVYEGEWKNDMRNGMGMLRLANENRYEGEWKNDKKHGDGKFYHLDRGHLFIGTWVEGICKCGTMEDFNRENAVQQTRYLIPQLKLKNADDVLRKNKPTMAETSE